MRRNEGIAVSSLRQPFDEHRVKRIRIDGLGDKIIHPRLKAGTTVFLERIGRHRQDGNLAAAEQPADGAGGFQSVHFRHLDVHQDEVIGGDAGLVDGFSAIARRVDL